MKTLSIFGTRPEAIKMAPLIRALSSVEQMESFICSTAQHKEMLDPFLKLFQIKIHFDLNVMKPHQTLSDLTASILVKVRSVLEQVKPDLVFVQGDTTSAMAGALASFYEKIPVAHIEAGLRSGHMLKPFPEEMNRKLIGSLAACHFAPTELSRQNLMREGVASEHIFVTGNTVIDALFYTLKTAQEPLFPFPFLKKKLILVTGHRRESFGEGFSSICRALQTLSQRDDVQIIYPVHLNPEVQRPVYSLLSNNPNILLIPPLDYVHFVFLMNRSYLILTDSGGVQEEGPSLGKPVLVMRDVTERREALEAGTVKLVGTDEKKIVEEVEKLLDDPSYYQKMAYAHNPYGDGKAAKKIVEHVLERYANRV